MAEVYFGVPISQDRIQRALAYERTHNVPTKPDVVIGPPFRRTSNLGAGLRHELEQVSQLCSWMEGIRTNTEAMQLIAAREELAPMESLFSLAHQAFDQGLDYLRQLDRLAQKIEEHV